MRNDLNEASVFTCYDVINLGVCAFRGLCGVLACCEGGRTAGGGGGGLSEGAAGGAEGASGESV